MLLSNLYFKLYAVCQLKYQSGKFLYRYEIRQGAINNEMRIIYK